VQLTGSRSEKPAGRARREVGPGSLAAVST
jgi:hypothetical protein